MTSENPDRDRAVRENPAACGQPRLLDAPVASLGVMDSVASALERLDRLAATSRVSKLALAFQTAGHELALVGGPVRDAFLGRTVNDLDFTTSASPDEILEIVVPIAEAHWDVGRAFGTIAARIDEMALIFGERASCLSFTV